METDGCYYDSLPPRRGRHAPNKELLCGYVRQSDECSEATDAQHAKYQQVPHILAPPPTSPLTVYGRPASLLHKREIQQFS